jgi:hypothetical protein
MTQDIINCPRAKCQKRDQKTVAGKEYVMSVSGMARPIYSAIPTLVNITATIDITVDTEHDKCQDPAPATP